MSSKSADCAEIRELWSAELRNNVAFRARLDTFYVNDRAWRQDFNYKNLQMRQFYWSGYTFPSGIYFENPYTLIRPRLEWFSPGYWKCRLEGLWLLIQEDAREPGRFQARMELAWERLRCRAPPRHIYMRTAAEVYLQKKYARRRLKGQEFRKFVGAMIPDPVKSA
eukprot:Gregarina_sp_Pseudo_9__2618@NODE_2878_length_840_cov_64_342072_g2632_i0_p1_GENE_NODE_2878_length_840_cov_64_342072_g2632_i0NODE_2878_length_840_cov_64_342072_g2632_i0_p1_ORF_typecomplete_len166_score9_99_NODE_2878_length_840_cov_64_342072_g2632_i099596